MANIKVNSPVPVYNGQPLTFRAPAACSAISGLVVYYPVGDTIASRVFTLTDASGGNIGVLDNAFAKDAIVKVVLDTDLNNAFVQNPNTNTYLEGELAKKYSPTNKPAPADIGAAASSHMHTKSQITDFPTSMTPTAHNQGASTITAGTFAGQVIANSSGQTYSTSLLRNSKLVSAETNPTVNGEIFWTYG